MESVSRGQEILSLNDSIFKAIHVYFSKNLTALPLRRRGETPSPSGRVGVGSKRRQPYENLTALGDRGGFANSAKSPSFPLEKRGQCQLTK
jgi:hypothetical protein